MKRLTYICILLVSISCFFACNSSKEQAQTANNSQTTATTTVNATSGDLPMNPKYPHIPLADKGITVVSPDGWDDKTLEFHLGYCEQMLGSLNEKYYADKFCECFISKIQYYYEPIFFKEAYEDQTKWNTLCLEESAR